VYPLRCFGHLERINTENTVKRIWKKEIDGRKRKGRPHKTWNNIVIVDNIENGSFKDAGDHVRWRHCCRQSVDPSLPG